MTDYTITTNFGAKDSLPSGNAGKVIKGEEFTTEFTNIQTAINSKADTVSPTFTGNTALNGTTTFGPDGTATFSGTVAFNSDVTFDTNTLFVDVSANNVGIGTTNPQEELHISASVPKIRMQDSDGTNQYGEFYHSAGSTIIQARNNTTDGAIIFQKYDGTTTDETMRIDSSGKVGIGTIIPIRNLDVRGGTTDVVANFESSDTGGYISLQDNTTSSDTAVLVGAIGDALRIDTGDTESVRIDSSGKVGIGTSSPSTKLDVSGDVSIRGTFPTLFFSDTNNNPDYYISAGNGYFQIYDNTNNAGRFYIDSSGNVGIGTNSPAAKLHVQSGGEAIRVNTANENTHISFGGARAKFGYARIGSSDLTCIQGSTGKGIVFCTDNDTFGSGEKARIDSSGNLFVGKTAAALANVGVEARNDGTLVATKDGGTVAFLNRKTSNGPVVDFRKDTTTVGTISVSASATAYNTSSDERLKENITDSADAGSKIDAIQIRQFDWIADGSHQDYGVIAQELINVAPEAVSEGDTEEEMMGVDYSKLVPMLIKEVQSLRSRVAELENN